MFAPLRFYEERLSDLLKCDFGLGNAEKYEA